jgi:hypothetical protein
MRYAALSMGAGAPAGDFAGTILVVHPRVCVVSLADESLLTLVTPMIGRLPRSILVGAPSEVTFTDVLGVNANVAARSGILRFSNSAFSVDLRSAVRWRPCLSDLRLDKSLVSVVEAWRTASAAQEADGRSQSFVAIAGPQLAALATATCTLDAAAASNAMSGLVGLGEGATPAGDDYLVGYFGGLWACAGRVKRRRAFVAAAGQRLKMLTSRTGRISKAYLEAAVEGDVSERLFDLASSISNGSNEAIVGRAAAAVLAVGHSSGACGLLGFLQACECWSKAARANRRERP